ncbi:hypothetical protein PAEPH01_2709 [Pancytospora epiphaga]|nr:hypothetical protein PAEPH01_2709 [Pancytospora epiphaga]
MEQRDSHCPCRRPCEPTAKGTGLGRAAGKEDPVELDSSEASIAARASQRGGEIARPLARAAAVQVAWWGVWLGRHAR